MHMKIARRQFRLVGLLLMSVLASALASFALADDAPSVKFEAIAGKPFGVAKVSFSLSGEHAQFTADDGDFTVSLYAFR